MTAPKPAQRRRRTIPPKAREKFLEALRAGWSVIHAATRAGHARQRFYEARERDEEFALAWEEAVEAGTDRLEDEAFRRAVEGYDEDTFDGDGNGPRPRRAPPESRRRSPCPAAGGLIAPVWLTGTHPTIPYGYWGARQSCASAGSCAVAPAGQTEPR